MAQNISSTKIIDGLQSTKIFGHLSKADIEEVFSRSELVRLPGNWTIINEGDRGDYLYFVVSGSLQVFTRNADGKEIVLAKLGNGDYVGEQALLPGDDRKRNASVRTFESCLLLRISRESFLKAHEQSSQLERELVEQATKQNKQIMAEQSAIIQNFKMESASQWTKEVAFTEETTIFSQGDEGDNFYLLLDGTAKIYEEKDSGRQLLAMLEAGQGFGELALLKRGKRRATAIASAGSKVLQVDGEVFREIYTENPDVRNYFQTLNHVYSLRGYGLVTQHTGKLDNQDCITSLFHLDDGRTVSSSQVVGHDVVNVQVSGVSSDGSRKLNYVDPSRQINREIEVLDGKIIRITSYNLWRDLGKAHHLLLSGAEITDDQIQLFLKTGQLTETEKATYGPSDIMCHCMQINYGTLLDAIEKGMNTEEKIVAKYRCGTVCGSCKPQLKELLGESGWHVATITDQVEVSPGIRSFRFKPYDNRLRAALPGQHMIIKAPIGEQWVTRPYTITSPSTTTDYREITVKREPGGYFSNWLFDQYAPDTLLQISEPSGEFIADIEKATPIVFFAAGIGVTPALNMLRSIIKEGSGKRLYIDYSVRDEDSYVYKSELEYASQNNTSLTVNFRNTERDDILSIQDVQELFQTYSDADFFICGPGAYQEAVKGYLKASGIDNERINIEVFTPVGAIPASEDEQSFLYGNGSTYIGLTLVALIALQAIFNIDVPGLARIQGASYYQVGSGLIVTALILYQWRLPLLRWQGQLAKAAEHYHLHKLVGAVTPLFFYLHSIHLGYAYTLLLSLVFLGNATISLLKPRNIDRGKSESLYERIFLPVHIMLSVSLVALSGYHALIAMAFK